MVTSEPQSAASARSEDQEPAYEGTRGRTHLRSVHVTLPNGFVRLVQVYDSVNVATDPHLKDPALAGALHRFETGDKLAIPFVYHDPKAHKFALVVPNELRHELLRLRSKLLIELAEDDNSPIPGYAAEATVVVGITALGTYLAAKPASAALGEIAEREKAVGERDAGISARESKLEEASRDVEIKTDALGQREARLLARAEAVTRREDELRVYAEELEAARADVRMQEQELESRMEIMQERESALTKLAESGATAIVDAADDDIVELVDDEVEEMAEVLDDASDVVMAEVLDGNTLGAQALDAEVVSAPGPAMTDLRAEVLADLNEIEELDDLEEIEELEPLETSPAAVPEDLSSAVEMVMESLQPSEDDIEELDDADVEEIQDVTGVHANLVSDELEASNTVIATPAEPEPEPAGPTPTVPPPSAFIEARYGAQAIPMIAEDGIRIFARLPAGKADLDGDVADLLVQLVVVEERPIVLLTVVEETDGRPTVFRAPLDPRHEDGHALLEKLRRECAARVSVYSSEGRYLRRIAASGPRELNVLRVLDRVAKMRTAAAVDVGTAMERVLSAPPPIEGDDHPFLNEKARKPASNAAEAKKALDEIALWSNHDRQDRALLGLSIPADHVYGTLRHVLEQAVAHGLPLTKTLVEHAISQDVAMDAAELIGRQIEALGKTTQLSDRGGLSGEEAATAWESLLGAAADAEVAIDTDTHEHAWNVIRKVRGGDTANVDPAQFPDLSAKELVLLLEHPKYREKAALELASRKDPAIVERLCKAVRNMPRAEVVRVVPKILEVGDEAGDALIDGLGARKTFVRQAFALSLGHLKLRRAVVPLLHLLGSEQSEVWREVARVLGGFGTASQRTISRQLKDPKGPKERYILTLAHLTNHGCEKQVDKLSKDERPSVATMAVEALTMRQEARTIEDRARGDKKLPKKDPVLEFSRRFYAELDGRSSDERLAD